MPHMPLLEGKWECIGTFDEQDTRQHDNNPTIFTSGAHQTAVAFHTSASVRTTVFIFDGDDYSKSTWVFGEQIDYISPGLKDAYFATFSPECEYKMLCKNENILLIY